MIRKDPAQDTERAHFYSQFWIEVAAGRPLAPSTQTSSDDEEEEELDEADLDLLMGATPMPATRAESKPKPRATEKKEPARSLSSLADLASIADLMSQSAQMTDEAVPDIEVGGGEGPETPPGFGLEEVPDEEGTGLLADEEEEPFDEFEDEEEEEDEWGGSRRPKPKKAPRRDRRGF